MAELATTRDRKARAPGAVDARGAVYVRLEPFLDQQRKRLDCLRKLSRLLRRIELRQGKWGGGERANTERRGG